MAGHHLAEGDVVRFQTHSDGLHWAVGRVSSADICTIRVVPIPSGPLGRSPQAVHQRLWRSVSAVKPSARTSPWWPSPHGLARISQVSRHS
ncbi:DUF4265 domain-containing protein [Streptomyces rhizosphaerihabitans]|nr:DUF4265 domain-containing protein [Streptomyces rhizosphaerihabitans]MCT9007088.1 DUF4265 domain-containing protein [Streptomyces rhizosphaerihabitans]